MIKFYQLSMHTGYRSWEFANIMFFIIKILYHNCSMLYLLLTCMYLQIFTILMDNLTVIVVLVTIQLSCWIYFGGVYIVNIIVQRIYDIASNIMQHSYYHF